jgi:hypothetical protein
MAGYSTDSTTQGDAMVRKDLIAAYGRIGLVIAAFVFIAGIIAAPILPRFGSPVVAAAKPHHEPMLRLPLTPASLRTN